VWASAKSGAEEEKKKKNEVVDPGGWIRPRRELGVEPVLLRSERS